MIRKPFCEIDPDAKNLERKIFLALHQAVDGHHNDNLSAQESARNIRDNIVSIVCTNDRQTIGAGTGFQITTDGFILTAAHVIKPFASAWNRWLDNNPEPEAPKERLEWLEALERNYFIVNQPDFEV